MQPLSPETTIMILRSSLQYNLPNDCQAQAKQKLSSVAGERGGWKSTRQEPTLEKLNLRLPLQWYRTTTAGFPGPSGSLGWRSSASPLPATCAQAGCSPSPTPGSRRGEGRGRAEKSQQGQRGGGWRPTDSTGSEGGARRGPTPAGKAQTKARRPRWRAGEGRAPAQAQTVAAPPQAARRPRFAPAPALAWPAAPTHRPGPCP